VRVKASAQRNALCALKKVVTLNKPRILSLSCVFPNPADPGLGLFVRARLNRLGQAAEVKVIAPIARIDFATTARARFGRRGIPFRRRDGDLEILHPAWTYLPGGFAINPVLLFQRVLPLAWRLRRRFDFQIIDSHFGFPDGIAAALLSKTLGVPFTITLRGSEVVHAEYRWRRKLMAWAMRKASRVFAVSERLRQFALVLGAESNRAKTIPNGVDPARFYPRDREPCRRRFGIAADAKIVLSAGTLIELKGHHRVARAVAGLRKRGIEAELLIAGRGGRYESELRRQIAESGMEKHVRLLGELPAEELAEVMSASDVVCLASSREGWPNVVHEAMACGTPVVATNVGAVEVMVGSREHGLVVPPGDPTRLEQALFDAFQKQWDREGIRAWGHFRTWDRVTAELLSEFREVAGEPAESASAPAAWASEPRR
jgi:teichuronic acid biosynthesis glycosyltransferase TuaC